LGAQNASGLLEASIRQRAEMERELLQTRADTQTVGGLLEASLREAEHKSRLWEQLYQTEVQNAGAVAHEAREQQAHMESELLSLRASEQAFRKDGSALLALRASVQSATTRKQMLSEECAMLIRTVAAARSEAAQAEDLVRVLRSEHAVTVARCEQVVADNRSQNQSLQAAVLSKFEQEIATRGRRELVLRDEVLYVKGLNQDLEKALTEHRALSEAERARSSWEMGEFVRNETNQANSLRSELRVAEAAAAAASMIAAAKPPPPKAQPVGPVGPTGPRVPLQVQIGGGTPFETKPGGIESEYARSASGLEPPAAPTSLAPAGMGSWPVPGGGPGGPGRG
jgi:hypothetical protein